MKLTSIIVAAAVLLLILIARSRSEDRSPSDPRLDRPATDADIDLLLRAGRKIDAIKVYRRLHGVDLKAAKDAVDFRVASVTQRDLLR